MSVQTIVIAGQTLCASNMPVGGGGSQGGARVPERGVYKPGTPQ